MSLSRPATILVALVMVLGALAIPASADGTVERRPILATLLTTQASSLPAVQSAANDPPIPLAEPDITWSPAQVNITAIINSTGNNTLRLANPGTLDNPLTIDPISRATGTIWADPVDNNIGYTTGADFGASEWGIRNWETRSSPSSWNLGDLDYNDLGFGEGLLAHLTAHQHDRCQRRRTAFLA